jgi:hypothetical protein
MNTKLSKLGVSFCYHETFWAKCQEISPFHKSRGDKATQARFRNQERELQTIKRQEDHQG